MNRGAFRVVPEGGPIFFRLKAPDRANAGFTFLAAVSEMSVALAWEVFGERNGDPTFERFAQRLGVYRRSLGGELERIEDRPLSCLVLRHAVFLPTRDWLPWDSREGWADAIVSVGGVAEGDERGVSLANVEEDHAESLEAGAGTMLSSTSTPQAQPAPLPNVLNRFERRPELGVRVVAPATTLPSSKFATVSPLLPARRATKTPVP